MCYVSIKYKLLGMDVTLVDRESGLAEIRFKGQDIALSVELVMSVILWNLHFLI